MSSFDEGEQQQQQQEEEEEKDDLSSHHQKQMDGRGSSSSATRPLRTPAILFHPHHVSGYVHQLRCSGTMNKSWQ
jgi:hypothetical protein